MAQRLLSSNGDKEMDSGFSDDELQTVFALVITQSIIAIGSQLFIVFTYARFKELRKRSFELVLILACTSIVANISYTLAPKNKTGTGQCTTQGFMMLFFECAMIGWTTMIAYCLYCAVVLQRGSPSRAKMHGIVWTTCLVLSLLPLFTGSYGDSGPWCWIAGHDVAGITLRFVCFYIPLWVAFAVNAKIYYDVTVTLRRFALLSTLANDAGNGGGGNAAHAKITKMADNLRWYPLIFVVSWSGNTVIRVVQAFYPDYNTDYTLAVLTVVLHGTFYQSVANTFAYGFNSEVKHRWVELAAEVRAGGSCAPLCFLESNQADEEDDLMVDSEEPGVAMTVEQPPKS